MHQLNADNEDASVLNPFEPEHDVDPRLDVPVVLLNQVVLVSGGAQLRVVGQQAIAVHLAHRAMRGCITVQGNRSRHTASAFHPFP